MASVSGSAVAAPSSLSSSSLSPFLGSVGPRSKVASGNSQTRTMVVRASAAQFAEHRKRIQEPKTIKREILAGVMAAAASLVSSGNATADSAEGLTGEERTAQNADESLKAGDDLVNKDSPRFITSRRDGSLKASGKIAQQAGSGAVEGLQDSDKKSIEERTRNAAEAKQRVGDFANNSPAEAYNNVRGGVGDSIQNGPREASADVQTIGDKVKNDIASAYDKGVGKKITERAERLFGQSQDRVRSPTDESKRFLCDLKVELSVRV